MIFLQCFYCSNILCVCLFSVNKIKSVNIIQTLIVLYKNKNGFLWLKLKSWLGSSGLLAARSPQRPGSSVPTRPGRAGPPQFPLIKRFVCASGAEWSSEAADGPGRLWFWFCCGWTWSGFCLVGFSLKLLGVSQEKIRILLNRTFQVSADPGPDRTGSSLWPLTPAVRTTCQNLSVINKTKMKEMYGKHHPLELSAKNRKLPELSHSYCESPGSVLFLFPVWLSPPEHRDNTKDPWGSHHGDEGGRKACWVK